MNEYQQLVVTADNAHLASTAIATFIIISAYSISLKIYPLLFSIAWLISLFLMESIV